MRLFYTAAFLLESIAVSCGGHADLQCEQNSNCDLTSGGICANPGTGNHWCAYPDSSCPSGYRYSGVQVGDGVSGACVAAPDAGVDAEVVPVDGTPGQPAASCLALPHTCGANATDDCCNSLTVPGGIYFRSYDAAGDPFSGDMKSPATVSNFRLDKYEVTVGRFRAFVAANQGTQASPPAVGAGAHPNLPGSGWEASWNVNLTVSTAALALALKCDSMFQTWTDAPGDNENRPLNCITWFEAMAFCTWDGGYLPTEAEWNYAATGGSEQRVYPWSSPASSVSFDASRASYAVFDHSGFECLGDGNPGCAVTDLIEVGTKPAGDARWGQSDMAGNVDELVLDEYAGMYATPCSDCAAIVPGGHPMIRGGNFHIIQDPFFRTGWRRDASSSGRSSGIGVRCARPR